MTVHPRVCGEQFSAGGAIGGAYGSSPRVRGTATRRRHVQAVRRFIPACAGNRLAPTLARRAAAVHPRVCGEQTLQALVRASDYGSSPRVRGTVPCCDHLPEIIRLIPACAGNSASVKSRALPHAVHPRVCGEQTTQAGQPIHRTGSSPRVRGTDRRDRRDRRGLRFIPACAGNRRRRAERSSVISVHPRVCGEQPTR